MEVKEYLDDRIEKEFESLKKLEPGSEEHSRTIEDICKLAKVRHDYEKLDIDVDEKEQRRIIEAEVRNAEVDEKKKNQIIDICFRAVGIAAPMFLYLVLMVMGFNFEKEGTIRSKFFSNFINKILPTSFR